MFELAKQFKLAQISLDHTMRQFSLTQQTLEGITELSWPYTETFGLKLPLPPPGTEPFRDELFSPNPNIPVANALDAEIERFMKSRGGVLPKRLDSSYCKSKLMLSGFRRKYSDVKGAAMCWEPCGTAPLNGPVQTAVYDILKNDERLKKGLAVDVRHLARDHGYESIEKFSTFRAAISALHNEHGLIRYDATTKLVRLP